MSHLRRAASLVLLALVLALVAPHGAFAAFQPEVPLYKGLHLLPGTHAHDYGNLRPLDLGQGARFRYPASVDLSRYDMPVGQQGYVGSCTAWASTYSLVGWYINKEHLPISAMAPMYIYHQVYATDPKTHQEAGSWGSWAINATMTGLLPMGLYPQGNYNWQIEPSGTQKALARQWTVPNAYALYTMMDSSAGVADGQPLPTRGEQMTTMRELIEMGLAQGQPELVELLVYPNMYNATEKTAWIGPTKPTDKPEGGHDLIAVGYDSQGLWVQNQWGTDWGLNGYAELSWDYVLDNVFDTIVISGVKMTPHATLPQVYHGTPAITGTVVSDGIPERDQSALRNNQEIVWSAKGFKPGEIVRIYRDGKYVSYIQPLSDGTFTTEFYDHRSGPEGEHNLHWKPGWHEIKAVGESGDYAYRWFRTR